MLQKVKNKKRLHIRLYKVDQNNLFWILFFRDPVHHFIQTIIVPKYGCDPQEVEERWDTMWERMQNKLEETLTNKTS